MHSVTFYLPEEDFCYHTCFVFPQINTHVLQHRQSAFFKLIFMKGLIVFGASITLHMNMQNDWQKTQPKRISMVRLTHAASAKSLNRSHRDLTSFRSGFALRIPGGRRSLR